MPPTEFSELQVFDLYLHDVREAAHAYDRSFGKYFPHWTICRSSGAPDPTIDLCVAEKYWPMTESMQAEMELREDVFA